jgi:hypothetical protein
MATSETSELPGWYSSTARHTDKGQARLRQGSVFEKQRKLPNAREKGRMIATRMPVKEPCAHVRGHASEPEAPTDAA